MRPHRKEVSMKKRVAVLGATGSIGKNTLDVLRSERDFFEPVLFSAHNKKEQLLKLKEEFPGAVTVLEDGLLEAMNLLHAIASSGADITVNGISGAAGLEPSVAVIASGSALALANKETIVMAGPFILALAREKNVPVIPVDSEHSALFKLLEAHGKDNAEELILTASGGPFRNCSAEELSCVTPEKALAHPTWNMGPKISVDSATLANKGLEVIEASYLFGFPPEKIKVTIHPQSVVHSMVRLKNGAVYAQMSRPDMRLPIREALFWPETQAYPAGNTSPVFGALNFVSLSLSFEKPDFKKFPMLALAYEALNGGPHLPIVYNAANEEAVQAFFRGTISFPEISILAAYVLKHFAREDAQSSVLKEKPGSKNDSDSIEAILAIDREARKTANDYIYYRSKQC
jgi:1-deoxy-D-xylulose-5-phosphate reductoisomerase